MHSPTSTSLSATAAQTCAREDYRFGERFTTNFPISSTGGDWWKDKVDSRGHADSVPPPTRLQSTSSSVHRHQSRLFQKPKRPYALFKRPTVKHKTYMSPISTLQFSKAAARNWADQKLKEGKIVLPGKRGTSFETFPQLLTGVFQIICLLCGEIDRLQRFVVYKAKITPRPATKSGPIFPTSNCRPASLIK